MTAANLSELIETLNARTSAMMTAEPDEIHQFRSGTLENKAGSYGQYFGTWEIAAGMIRDYSMYTMYPALQLAENTKLDHDQFVAVMEAFDPPYSNYLRYSGFPEMGELAVALRKLIQRSQSRDEIIAAMRAYVAYTNRLAAWSFHFFPWNLGKHFEYDEPEVPPPDVSDLKGRVKIRNGVPIRLTWEPLGISVKAVLASEENPELCQDVLDALPFTIVQDHAVVTGESMYAWTPIVSTAPIRVRERICDAPQGRIRFSQSTGQKFIVQYGPTTEDLAQPVLGEILPPGTEKLPEVGRKVWESTYETKELIWLTVERG
jgi:hypothetical protein